MPLVTENMIYTALRNDVARTGFRLQTAQLHVAAGKRVLHASDDPVAAAQISVYDASLHALQSMANGAHYAQTQASSSDQAMGAAQTLVARAKELAIQAATGSICASDRANFAEQAAQLHDDMVSLANTQVAGSYVFAGFLSDDPPFASDGTYAGDAGVRQVEVAPGQTVAVNIAGSQVFNVDGGQNVIALLSELQAHLQANDVDALHADMDALDQATVQLGQARSQVGAHLSALQNATARRQEMGLLLSGQRAALGDLDQTVGITDMLQAQSAYQAAVAQASRMLDMLSRQH